MGVILYILSYLLRVVIVTTGVIYGLVKGFIDAHIGDGFVTADKKFLFMAKSVDKYGNAVCQELFNDTLIKKESNHKFGRIDQTISIVIGYNLQAGTLTKTGRALNAILNFFEKDHSIKAISRDQ